MQFRIQDAKIPVHFLHIFYMSQIKLAQRPRVPLRCHVQHYLNPLHFYCRLRDWGISSKAASRLCSRYERIYRTLFKGDSLSGM